MPATLPHRTKNAPAPVDAGSRMHMLDWVDGRGGDFLASLNRLLPPGVQVATADWWLPRGRPHCTEALLSRPCEPLLPGETSAVLRKWWLAVDHHNANEPNWDLAATATFQGGRRGLVLVEAKAHEGELLDEAKGKSASSNPANHGQIGRAIAEAQQALGGDASGVRISRDVAYQFSNRVAVAWKVATLGHPVALIYLGFTGDTGIVDRSPYLRDHDHWRRLVEAHIETIFPLPLLDAKLPAGSSYLWVSIRSLPCARPSPPPGQRPLLPVAP